MDHDISPAPPATMGRPERRAIGNTHWLEISTTDAGHELRITNARGEIGVAITVQDDGIVLRLDHADLAIRSSGGLAISAEHLCLEGRSGMHLSSGGDMTVEAAGDLRSEARVQTVRARLGDVKVKANDDVKLNGERILLNC